MSCVSETRYKNIYFCQYSFLSLTMSPLIKLWKQIHSFQSLIFVSERSYQINVASEDVVIDEMYICSHNLSFLILFDVLSDV